ncbi:hypothetical protein MKK55_09780 [Methylobacterium sp. J-059]|uniref:hypothetical protein n=1 Tax=Methylobacterium sp. J-059 TaxID=2836643 RepID=UPI001FB907BE|nr:hypothetical protein [Methylobacterium sp. J-059]MCJ2039229.1 hypothetical protein [Methylobacterium sp. J-059]
MDQGTVSRITSSLFGSVAKGGGGFLLGLFGCGNDSGLSNFSFSPFATGGIMPSRRPVSLNAYANDGIADTPQMALFGEGRMPDAYVPLPDGKRIPVATAAPANGNGTPYGVNNCWSYGIDASGAQIGVVDQIVKAIRTYDAEKSRTQAEDREFARRAAF